VALNGDGLSYRGLPVITPLDILQNHESFCFEKSINLINFLGNIIIEIANGFGIEFRLNFRKTCGMNDKPYLMFTMQNRLPTWLKS